MTDTINHKVKALELANQFTGEKPGEIVARATAYHAFLAGTAAPAAGAATAGASTTKTPPAGGTATKPGAAGAAANKDKGAAGATTGKSTTPPKADAAKGATAGKPTTPPKADAAKAGAAGASAGAVPADTKAEGGKYTYAEVVAKLRDVSGPGGVNRAEAFKILADVGKGAKSVRELKPAEYDAVATAAIKFLAKPAEGAAGDDDLLGDPPENTGGGLGADDDPTAQPERDDMGLA